MLNVDLMLNLNLGDLAMSNILFPVGLTLVEVHTEHCSAGHLNLMTVDLVPIDKMMGHRLLEVIIEF